MYNDNEYTLSPKSVVYDQFPVWKSNALGSPGEANTFWYKTADEGKTIPSLVISGDDDGMMYMADPVMTDGSWNFGEYTVEKIYQSGEFNPADQSPVSAGTLGKHLVLDLDGDGCNEVVVANYHNKQVVILEQEKGAGCR